jgi:hypothetical protein
MADVAVKQVGDREYRVFGLQALGEEIRGAGRQLSESTGTRHDAAVAALVDWRGRHAAAFVERVNLVLSGMVSLQLEVERAAARCRAFPGEPAGSSSTVDQYAYMGARVYGSNDPGTSSATPSALRDYAAAATDQAGHLSGAAAKVTTDGLTADVMERRSLTSQERQDRLDQGMSDYEVDQITVWGERQPAAVTEVFGLPDLSGQATGLKSDSDDLSEWVTAVAFAFEKADDGLLQLLLDHPEIAGYFADGLLPDGRMTGEASLALILANLGLFDTAGGRGDPDGVVGLSDLEAIANDPSVPAHLRDAAQYLLSNRLLLSMASLINDDQPFEIEPDDARLTADGISTFLQFNHSLNAVALNFDSLDTAAHGGDPDGYVSVNDLRAAADDSSLPQDVQDAAAFLLANGALTQRIQAYERANVNRLTYDYGFASYGMTDDPSGFNRNGVIALAIDQQAFPDPGDARRFVQTLPVADAYGNGGLPITLTSDEGVKALANTALLDARNDLTDQHEVIARLPETTGWNGSRGAVEQAGGVRNTLINGFYDLLSKRADGVFAGDLAGHPELAGHPGANWLMFAPWASNGVHGVITGDITGPLGFTTSGIQQGAADGNQFIFNDIGARFAAFVEMYEHNPRPSEGELERFFSTNFHDGDGTIRDGFAAYVAAVEEDDPVRKQQLLFQGNTLVATHEQAGVQPYLEDVSFGPDSIATDYVELQIGRDRLAVKNDVPAWTGPNNHIIPTPLLSLDTGDLTAENFLGDQTRFNIGGQSADGVVDMSELRGTEAFQPDFSRSTRVWWEEGAGDANDPESLEGSNASSWPDWNERMNYIVHLFEQNHANPELFNTDSINVGFENVDWLADDARPRG